MTPPAFKNNARASVFAIGLAVLFAQLGGQAQVTPVILPFADEYLITGNYFVGSVDLPSTGGGSSTGRSSSTTRSLTVGRSWPPTCIGKRSCRVLLNSPA